jgi:hypothetical protein
MSLKTFVIVIAALVLLFVFGLGSAACGGLSSGTGIVDAASGLLGAPHLKTEDLRATNPSCIDAATNTLVVPTNSPCVYALDDSVFLDRRLVLKDGVTPNVQIQVKQEGLVTFKDTFPLPPGEEFRAFIERKRSMIIKKEPSLFTVTCTRVPPNPAPVVCRFPLK